MTPRWLHWPASAGVAWTPASLSSLRVWFDADSLTGLSDGDAMSSWSDSSGNGNNVANTQATLKPTYETNELNGKPVVRFYNSSGFSGTGNVYSVTTTDVQVAVVAKWNSVNNVAIFDVNNYAPLVRVISNQLGVYAVVSGGNRGIQQGTISSGSWFVGLVMVDWPNQMLYASLNGNNPTSIAWNNTATSIGPLGSTSVQVGARYDQTTVPFDGDIAEVVMVTNDPTTATRDKLEGYLAHKWGLTSNLPSTHPYKSSAP